MDDHPKMLYRFPATGENSMSLEGSAYDTRVVADETAEAAALDEGWCATWPAAKEAHVAAQQSAASAAQTQSDAVTPPTRAELEQKATELGIKFDGRTSDKKLGDLIAATLET